MSKHIHQEMAVGLGIKLPYTIPHPLTVMIHPIDTPTTPPAMVVP